MWLLALYVALAEEQGVDADRAAGHDAERHRQGVPVARHVHLPARAVAAADRRHVSRSRVRARARSGTRSNVCSYHLQEAGATPVQELAYALATAIGVLDAVRDVGPGRRRTQFARGRRPISFFVNAGIRFVEEMCKMRAFTELWDRICARALRRRPTRSCRRFRYGVQVNSLGLTEAQPENNVQRIVLETLGVTLSKRRPRPRAAAAGVERGARRCPGRGTSSGRCASSRCWPSRPTCSSTRTSSRARRSSRRKTDELDDGAEAELERVLDGGRRVRGDRRAHEGAPRASDAERVRRIETGDRPSSASTVHRDRAVAARGGERRRHLRWSTRGRARARRRGSRHGATARDAERGRRRARAAARAAARRART